MEKKYDDRLNKDRKLGTFIAENLKKDGDVGQCPSIEDIAALVDGKLAGNEKEQIIAHITKCQDCYEIFSETSRTILSLSKGKRQKITWISIPAVALAACLILVVRIVFLGPATDLPYSHKMIKQLAPVLETNDLEKGLTARGQGYSGLAGTLGLVTLQQQQAFRTGFNIAGLELATVDENSEQSQKQLSELGKILKLERGSPLIDSFKKLEGFLNMNKFLEASEEINLIQSEITADTKAGAISSFYHLGMWCSIGQVVFKSGNGEAIKLFLSNKESPKSMKLLLEKEGVPKAILEDLGKIIVITEGETLGDSDYQDISRHIQRIINYLLI